MSTRTTSSRSSTIDGSEVARFDQLAAEWWDPKGPMRPLHQINPVRLAFIRDEVCGRFGRDARQAFPFDGLSVLDVGCGAGLLSEPMARLGAAITGLDPAQANIAVARSHAEQSGLTIDYRSDPVETLAAGERFDVVVAMEVVEHVRDVDAFLRACADVVAPGGLLLLSTINRTLRSFALAIVGAEYVLRWLPRGTHDWDRFVTPAELRGPVESVGLIDFRTRGTMYDPINRDWRLSPDTAVNYLAVAAKPGGAGG